jgi:hypothetical protein
MFLALPAAAQPPATSAPSGETQSRRVVRATRISTPIALDGRLNDDAYRIVPAIAEFVQQEPTSGAPISERTEVWILFDDSNIYVACRCSDEHPERIVANDMRRDSSNIANHDSFAVAFNTFNDQRNGFLFQVTPAGAMRDGTTTEQRASFDWNPVWDGKATRFEAGWIAEMAIPFKSLRYKPGRDQTWMIQVRRTIRSKNELAYLTRVSPAVGTRAVHRFADAATLAGLEAPPAALNFEVKPYAVSRLTTNLTSDPRVENDVDPDAGIDLKYGVTESLTADLTINTDFAQVEADEAQVNLTRFSLSFPEKREFFLEGQDIFEFGNSSGGDLGGDAPTMFYSRRIGLAGSQEVPVMGGARLTGKAGPWSIGGLNMETDRNRDAQVERTNFSVVRLRRDVLRRSSIGALFTRRSVSTLAPGGNTVWGIDANLAFYQNVYVYGYLAQSNTESQGSNDLSYRAAFNYAADRYGLSFDRLVVEEHFNPEVGLLRRENFRRSFARGRFSPRTTNNRLVRKWTYETGFDYITNNLNELESREANALFRADLHSGDSMSVEYSRLYERLDSPFQISQRPRVRIPVGGYDFDNLRLSYTAGAQHKLSGSAGFEVGSFYTGDKKTATFRGRVEITPQLGIEPNLSLNWVDLREGHFTDKVVGGRTTFTMTPRMFVAALIQYSSSASSLSTNLRFRWEYRPGSELFVVYTEGRTTLPPRGTDLENRGLVVKVNRLLRF